MIVRSVRLQPDRMERPPHRRLTTITRPNRRRLARLLLAVSFLTWTRLHAQELELGGNAAFAGKVVVTPQADKRAVSDGGIVGAGVEACAWCGDRFALFGEYSHWARLQSLSSATKGLTGVDIAGGGLRIQGPTLLGSVRSFVDVGLGVGRYRWLQSGENKVYGFIAGYGVVIPISDRWYVRPQSRLYLMADKICFRCPFFLGDSRALLFLSAGVGVGIGL